MPTDDVEAGPTTPISGVVKPSDEDPDTLLFAVHDDAATWLPIPRAMVRDLRPTGTQLLGLSPQCQSVFLDLAPPVTMEGQVLAGLLRLHAQMFGVPDTRICYDQNGAMIPCPED